MRGTMKAIVLHGSPHRNGNSATLAEHFLQGSGIKEVQHFYTNELSIRPCQGCEKCFTNLPHHCATLDDMQLIYSAFIASDVIVFATPMYWGYMTAQLKAVMDRMEAITDHFAGKTFVVLITYRHHYQSTQAFFERVCPYFKVKLHVLSCCTMDENGNDVPIQTLPGKLEDAFALGKQVANINGGG